MQPRAARLRPEAADADDPRSPPADGGGRGEEARHADGHSDSLAPSSQTGGEARSGRRDRQGEGGALVERQVVGRHRAEAGRRTTRCPTGFDWDLWLGVAADAAVHRRRLLPPRQLAEAARLRHRHVRRHGLPHPRPGVRRARRRQPALGPLRVARTERLQLGARRAGEVRVPRHEVHDRHGHADVVQRQATPAGGRAEARGPQAERPGFDLHRRRGACCTRRTSRTPVLLPADKLQGLQDARGEGRQPLPPVRRSRPRATARRRPRSATPARSRRWCCSAASRRGSRRPT